MAKRIQINNEVAIEDTKKMYLNNGDLVTVEENGEVTHYLVTSYVDPNTYDTSPMCALIQPITGNKLYKDFMPRQISMKSLVTFLNKSYYHSEVSVRDVIITSRDDFYFEVRKP